MVNLKKQDCGKTELVKRVVLFYVGFIASASMIFIVLVSVFVENNSGSRIVYLLFMF